MKAKKLKDDLARILHGEPLTPEQRERHEEAGEGFHVPVIVHRTGGVSAKRLNACGICGAQIVPSGDGGWLAVSDDEADRVRKSR